MNKEQNFRPLTLFCTSIMVLFILTSGCTPSEPPPENAIDGWAVLAEKDFFEDVDMENLSGDYINIVRMRQALEASG